MSTNQESPDMDVVDGPSDQTVTPLADVHVDLGARLAPYLGVDVPAEYGDVDAEASAMREGCAVVDRSWISRIEMTGEDRGRFLNGLVTCDVKSLESGQGVYGFVTTVKGRVMADLTVLALEDRLWIELPSGLGAEISAHLRKYVIVDRVEIQPLEDRVPLTLIGPETKSVLGLDGLPSGDYEHLETTFSGCGVRLVRQPLHGPGARSEAWTLWTDSADAPAVFDALIQAGATPAGYRAYERLRVEAGRPLFGVDFGPENFPQETGLEDQGVSYTKGCYLGQEVVARIHYRGGVNRHLRGLVFDDEASMAATDLVGKPLLSEGRQSGVVTSVVETSNGQCIGLSILHQRAAVGADIEVEGGGSARIVELPFDA